MHGSRIECNAPSDSRSNEPDRILSSILFKNGQPSKASRVLPGGILSTGSIQGSKLPQRARLEHARFDAGPNSHHTACDFMAGLELVSIDLP